GSLLTSTTDFKITIIPDFEKPDYVEGQLQEIADGVLYNDNTKTYLIQNANGLKWFATAVDGVTRSSTADGTFKGYTVEIVADIDLENKPWTPIKGANFVGTFDGKGHTIKNLTINVADKTPAGLFASAKGVIKNLNIESVNINGFYKAGAVVGDGLCSRIENCHVNGGTITIVPLNKDDGNHAGGIVGYLSAEPTAYVKDCSVQNLNIKAYRDVAGLVGTATGSSAPVITGNEVRNVTVLADQLPEYVAVKDANAGEIVGRNIKGADLSSNTAENVDVAVLVIKDGKLDVASPAVFAALSEAVTSGNTFAGVTVELTGDIDLSQCKTHGNSNSPIGDDAVFEGTFDGKGHSIKNLYQSGWDFGYEWGSYGSLGLFSELNNATVKNVVIEDLYACVEGGDISFIAGSATGNCVFENITITNSSIGTYNNGCGGIIGWSGAGTYTFKNIKIGSDVVLGGLWGSFDSSIGGIVGQAEPGATYNFENVEINCRIDAYNDCTASYDYYNYRMCGMIVGRCEETTTINGVNYPDLSKYNMTFNNVVVNYGDWMNYHYCEPTPGHNGGRGMRVEPGFEYGGLPEDFDHSQCTTNHMACIPFDQLIGGDQLGVKGLREVQGVTVNYPASFVEPVANATELKEALNKGMNVVLTENVDYGTTQLALTGSKVDLNGHTLTTNMTYGGISMKDGASIMNGVIKHTTTVAAIKAFNVGSIENVIIKTTCQTANKTVTGIAIQQGGHVGTIKNVTIEGVSQGIEVGYQATVDLIEEVNVVESTNGTAEGIALAINGGKVVKATKCSFKGEAYGVKMLLKGVFDVALELEDCDVEGGTAAIAAYDEKGISNTSGSLVLTYDAATVLTGALIWDFEDECKDVVTLNQPE
ncbi:MAG: hypothetical protein UHY58_02645, partial [Alistipes sp.]|nr:hypothetical protein [Alistipes sp.]